MEINFMHRIQQSLNISSRVNFEAVWDFFFEFTFQIISENIWAQEPSYNPIENM